MDASHQNLIYLLTQASAYSAVVPMLAGLWRWSRLGPAQRLLVGLLVFIAINQLVATLLWELWNIPNMPLYHGYVAVESVLLVLIYRRLLDDSLWRKLLPWLLPLGPLGAFVDGQWLDGWLELPTLGRGLEAAVMLGCASVYFVQLGKRAKVRYLDREPGFWITCGIMLYFPANMLLFLFNNYLHNVEDSVIYALWASHAVVNVLLYASYLPALLCQKSR